METHTDRHTATSERKPETEKRCARACVQESEAGSMRAKGNDGLARDNRADREGGNGRRSEIEEKEKEGGNQIESD